jgi:hypothetical protein
VKKIIFIPNVKILSSFAMKTKTFIILLLLPTCIIVAQQKREISHYLFPNFTKGTILMKSGSVNEATLNYNSLSEEVVYRNSGQIMAVADYLLSQMDTIYISNKKFVYQNNMYLDFLTKKDDITLFAQHKCELNAPPKTGAFGKPMQTANTETLSSFEKSGNIYALQLPDGYTTEPFIVYWIEMEGELINFKNIGQLRRIFSDKKSEIKDFTKKNKVDFKNPEDVQLLIEHLI